MGSGTRNRLLDAKLDKNKTHFSIENITETLKNMEVVNVGDMYYMSTYNGSQICTALNTVFDLELDKKYYLPKELNKKNFNLTIPYNISKIIKRGKNTVLMRCSRLFSNS